MPSDRALLEVLRSIRPIEGPALETIAARAGWSPFHLHRAFRAMVGETPKQYTLRLRLECAVARLITSGDAVLDIALAMGFNSHEVFTRAFRRRFGCTPAAYRASFRRAPEPVRRAHAAVIETAGACIGLYHIAVNSSSRRAQVPTLSIERRDLSPQPFLFVRAKAGRHEIAKAIAEALGKAFPYAMQAGLAIAGRPTARYLSTGPGLFDMQIGVPLAAASPGHGDVQGGELPGGPFAVGVHAGSYDSLSETYVAMERWMESNGYRPGRAPWESYVTDPSEFPDVKDWRTEIYWPWRSEDTAIFSLPAPFAQIDHRADSIDELDVAGEAPQADVLFSAPVLPAIAAAGTPIKGLPAGCPNPSLTKSALHTGGRGRREDGRRATCPQRTATTPDSHPQWLNLQDVE